MSVAAGLARRSVGGGVLWTAAVTASSPMTVLAGGMVATFAGTGVVGVPLSFVVIAVGLAPSTVALVAAARHVPHPATVYAVVARGLGRAAGVGAGAVAVVSYVAIGSSLFGLLGALLHGLVGGVWWGWALLAWLLVAGLGVCTVTVSLRLLVVLLAAQLAVVAVFDIGALRSPAGGVVSLAGLDPGRLFVDGLGGVMALGVAAFVGFETVTAYGEEARTRSTVARATLAALGCLGGLYALTAWAMTVAAGPDRVAAVAADPDGGLPFSVVTAHTGQAGAALASAVLVVAIVAAMLSFHHSVARYLFALGRERVLPAALAKVGFGQARRGAAPVAGSLVGSGIALVLIVATAVVGADPVRVLFTWLSTLAAVGVLAVLVACSWAALRFFRHGGGTAESWTVRVGAPRTGIATGVVMLAVLTANVHALLGVGSATPVTFAPVAVIGLAALAGLGWGGWLRRRRPGVYAGIGHGSPHPLAVPEARLADLMV